MRGNRRRHSVDRARPRLHLLRRSRHLSFTAHRTLHNDTQVEERKYERDGRHSWRLTYDDDKSTESPRHGSRMVRSVGQ